MKGTSSEKPYKLYAQAGNSSPCIAFDQPNPLHYEVRGCHLEAICVTSKESPIKVSAKIEGSCLVSLPYNKTLTLTRVEWRDMHPWSSWISSELFTPYRHNLLGLLPAKTVQA